MGKIAEADVWTMSKIEISFNASVAGNGYMVRNFGSY